jgi:hypothetical protein
MEETQNGKNITSQSQMKKSWEDIVNTTNPFTLFFKIW